MSSIKLESNASGTGVFTIASPNSNTNRTLSIPDTTTTIVGTDATQTLTNKTLGSGLVMGASALTSGTAVASTSGTSIDFTGIPSWVKRITVVCNAISTNGTGSIVQVQLGDSGGIETTGYTGILVRTGGTNVYTSAFSSGFLTQTGMVPANTYGIYITLVKIDGNSWVVSGTSFSSGGSNDSCYLTGAKTLSDTLTQVRITTVNGTDTFDAGTINILYE